MFKPTFDIKKLSRRDLFYIPVILILLAVGTMNFHSSERPYFVSRAGYGESVVDDDRILEFVFKNDKQNLQKVKDLQRQIREKCDKLSKPCSKQEQMELEKQLTSLQSEYKHYQNTIVENMMLFIDQKDAEITKLHAEVKELIDHPHPSETALKNKVAVINLNIHALNKKDVVTHKSRQTLGLKVKMRLNNTSKELGFDSFKIVVTDPQGKVISSDKDVISLSKNPNSFVFKPSFKYAFKPGRYTVKLVDKSSAFEETEIINLI